MEAEQDNSGGTSTTTNVDRLNLAVGTVVQVQARTWPGINKPGGVGRITHLHVSNSKVTDVDVHYIVMGGRERRVPIRYVKLAPEYDVSSPADGVAASAPNAAPRSQRNQLRDRSIMLGRCKRCGSLRTDCGSCDWMEQERLAEQVRHQPADTGDNVEGDRKVTKKRRRIQTAAIEEPLSSSSSSSSDEELLETMQAIDRRRRRYSREKVQWRRLLGDSSCESSQREDGSHDESSLSSSDLDDPILVRLAQVTRHQRRTKSNLLELKYAKPKKKRRRRHSWQTTADTLESLRDPRTASNITSRTALVPDSFQLPSPAVSPKSHREIEPSATVENVGDPDASPESDASSPDSDQSEVGTKEHRCTRFDSQEVYAPGSSLDLEGMGFIQPEGEVAAEHLPKDIVDRTLSVPFKQLPSFFDKLVMELQDEFIPDANLVLSDFEQKSRKAHNCDDSPVLPRSKEERHILYSRIQQKLIMDGVDQCRAAMRRMVNHKLRRRYKTSMTADEQKQFRSTALDLRDIKLDELGQMAEKTMKKAGDLLLDVRVMNDDSDVGDGEVSASDGANSEASASMLTQDLVDVGTYRTNVPFEGDDASPLPPFDPHMHATKVKSTKSRKQGSNRRSAGNLSRGKRKAESRKGGLSFEDTNTVTRSVGRGPASQKRRRGRRRSSSSDIQESDGTSAPDSDQSLLDADLMSFEAHDDAATASRANERRSCGKYSGTSDGTAGADIQFFNESGSNREPIADRMQAFLDANSSNIDGFSGSLNASNGHVNDIMRPRKDTHLVESSGHPNPKTKAPRARRTTARHDQTIASDSREAAHPGHHGHPFFEPDSSAEGPDEEATNTPMNLATEMMYRRLIVRKEEMPPSSRVSHGRLSAPLLDSCKALLAAYPESPDDTASLFEGIVNHFKAETPTKHWEAVEVFRTVLLLLRRHDNMTLQAISLTDSRYLQLHIRLLIFTLNLLESKVGSALVSHDGNIYCLFGHGNAFVEMVVLQMVDVIYAQVQRRCWALDSFRINGLMGLLGPLRDALARVVPLVETVSHCIMQKFQCQKWQDYVGRSESFVSAVDTEEYKSFLLDGKMPTSSSSAGSVRFRCFKTAIPRREIETIWTLFAFCADAPAVDCDEFNGDRWRLIASLFFSDAGVLSKHAMEPVGNDAAIPPSKEHIKICLLEIGYLSTLITTTTLNPLPSSDGILIKLVQKCLHLQAQKYMYSYDSVNADTMRGLDTVDRARLSRMWSMTNLLLNHDPRAAMDATSIATIAESDVFGEHMDCMRVSGLITGALSTSAFSEVSVLVSLIWAWVRQLPKKKARRFRLVESLNKLVSDFIDKASKLEQANIHGARGVNANSIFEEAFAPTLSNNGSRCAATAYREAAARLSVTWAYTRTTETTLTEELRNKVWESLADCEMKERQRCIVAQIASSGNLYDGDPFRLFSTVKTLAWLTGLHCGAQLDDTTTETTPQMPIFGLDDDRRSFVFLTSCFIACLDCACDQVERRGTHFGYRCEEAITQVESFSSLVSCVCLWLSQTCVRCRLFLKISPSAPNTRLLKLKGAAQELRTFVFGMLTSSLNRCLVCLTNSTVHGENGDSALRSVLGLIRAVVGLVSVRLDDGHVEPLAVETATEPPVPSKEPPEEDFFGSIDDALFLNIDVGTSHNPCQAKLSVDPDIHAFRQIWNLLIDMIKLTKPSDRYAVLPPATSMSSRSACMTVQGRTQAASNVGAICSCLAALTSLQKQDFDVVDSSLELLTGPLRRRGWNDQYDPDQSYLRQIVQCFYSEVCYLSSDYEQCDRLVRKRRDDVVEHFIEGMLDSNTLERFPSINLKRMKANGGPRSERKESLRLTLANCTVQSDDCELDSINVAGARLRKGEASDFPGPPYNSLHLWSFSANLRKLFSRTRNCPSIDGATGQNGAFMELDSDLSTKPPDMIPLVSLEKECLKRIALFRGMLSYSARSSCAEEALCFENLSRLIFSTCSYQLVQISEGVRYHARANREDGTVSYKHARLLELQSCYTELTVTLFAWVLREVPRPISDPFAKTLQHAKENFLSKVLLKRECNINSALRQLFTVATTGLVQNDIGVGGLVTAEADKPEPSLLDDMFFAAVRRSRQIVLHLASEQHAGCNVYFLLDSFLAVGRDSSESTVLDRGQGDYAAELIARSMECDVRKATAVSYLQMDRSLFQEALDEYMRHVELSRGLGSKELRSIQRLRHVAMMQFLVPMLIKDYVSLTKKRAILSLLSHLLQSEASRMASRQELLKIHAIVDLTKGLASCLRSVLESHTVDDALVCKAFQCARHVLNLPSPLNDDPSCQSQEDIVLSWSRHCNDDSDEARPPFSLYVWTFATWMNNVGKMLVGRTEEDKKRLVEFRSRSTTLTSQGRSIWNGDTYLDHDVLVASSRLIELEGKVFATKENGRVVTNVYAKPKLKVTPASASSSEVSEWHPSSSVRRAAKELMAEVIAVL